MAVKFSNNAATELASSIGTSDTSISVVDGSLFPALGAGDYTYVTLDADTDTPLREIVKVTAVSGNTLTVVRAQDGTTAAAFDAGAKVELRLTAALLNDVATEASATDWATVQNKPDPTVYLSGDVTGQGTMTDLGDVTISVTVVDDSHNHTVANVDGLQTALDAKYDASNPAAYVSASGARAAISATGSLAYDSATGVLSFTDAVTSVAGKSGVVTLTNADVGLGNVENKSSATIRAELTSANVTDALGYTPYSSANPSGYININDAIAMAIALG